jgi:hypothetical protein
MYGRFYQDDRDCGQGRGRGCHSDRRDFGPPPWAPRYRDWEDEPQSTPKERKAWLEAIKTRLETRLDQINAEIEKVGAEQK